MNRKQLLMELKGMNENGIAIFLEGSVSTPDTVANAVFCEQNSFMRDYVYEKGVLKELHFDKVVDN